MTKIKTRFKHIYFKQQEPIDNRKTQLWYCYNKYDNFDIGEVSWHAPWRKYAFKSEEPTVFCSECLRDIAQFIDSIKNKRR